MTLFHNQDPNLAVIFGQYQAGQGCTNVIGGKLTATFAVSGSVAFTYDPFIDKPVIVATYMSGMLTGSTEISFPQLTGVTNSNAYINVGSLSADCTGATIGLIIVGTQRL